MVTYYHKKKKTLLQSARLSKQKTDLTNPVTSFLHSVLEPPNFFFSVTYKFYANILTPF